MYRSLLMNRMNQCFHLYRMNLKNRSLQNYLKSQLTPNCLMFLKIRLIL